MISHLRIIKNDLKKTSENTRPNHIYKARVKKQQIRDFRGLMFSVGFTRFFEENIRKLPRKHSKSDQKKVSKIDMEKTRLWGSKRVP